LIKTLKEGGKTIIFSGHDLAQVEDICDPVLIMKDGIAVAYGTIRELKEQYGTTAYSITYESGGTIQELTIKDMDEMNQAVRKIVNDGGSISDVSVEESDLKEIFLGLVGIEE
jgi:ABC-2 type transport system ATP-binding protein